MALKSRGHVGGHNPGPLATVKGNRVSSLRPKGCARTACGELLVRALDQIMFGKTLMLNGTFVHSLSLEAPLQDPEF